jgi:hypothetical protein
MDEKFSNMPEQDQNAEAADNSYQQTMNYGYYSDGSQNGSGENNGAYQQNYNQNYSGNSGKKPLDAPLSMGEWLLTILAGLVPCVGIVLYFIWAFGANTNINRKNYSRAMLIVMAVVIVLYTLFFVVFGIAMSNALYY